jgi:Helix-turn-helix domain
MEIDIITKQDLEIFRQKLLQELSSLMGVSQSKSEKEYLRTNEVRAMLGGISAGTLQNLRVKGLLKPSKIEGVYYYKLSEVKALLNAGSGI